MNDERRELSSFLPGKGGEEKKDAPTAIPRPPRKDSMLILFPTCLHFGLLHL